LSGLVQTPIDFIRRIFAIFVILSGTCPAGQLDTPL
jgi:hypothetical protein